MIRSTLTAHLAESSGQDLTLQMNDRDIGLLASHNQSHYVMSGNRRVQMIAGLETDRDDAASIGVTRSLLSHWLSTFLELQINGLARFPDFARDRRLDAAFLLLMDSERVLVWCDEAYGVYLHRGRHLYRQQPTYPPKSDALRGLSSGKDFYGFRPREGDDLLVVPPTFLDLFNVYELEELLNDIRQMNVAMTELARVAASYGRTTDITWFAARIQQLERDPDFLSYDARERLAGRTRAAQATPWLSSITHSKVVPFMDGNVRIVPPGLKPVPRSAPVPAVDPYRPKPPRFTSGFRTEPIPPKEVSLEATLPKRDDTALPAAYRDRPSRLDRIKSWNADGIRQWFSRVHHRVTHLVPGSRGLSILSYVAIWLVILVILVAIVLSAKNKPKRPEDATPNVVVPKTSVDDRPKVDFEIEIEVKASSLRVVSKPGGTELVATVSRGETVTQLTKPDDGWVLIRLADGRSGYVPEALLLSPDAAE